MAKKPTFKEFLKESLQDPEFKEAYDALAPEFELIAELIQARKRARMSQADVARKIKVHQPSIARLERGGRSPSVARIAQYADAVGKRVTLKSKKSSRKPKKKIAS